MSKVLEKTAEASKKPAGVACRTWNRADCTELKDLYYDLVTEEACLPYPMEGGRRPDLAMSSAKWVRYSCVHPTPDDIAIKTFKKDVALGGFLAIHAQKRIDSSETKTWTLEDKFAISWATEMTARLQNLLRHCSQAYLATPRPPWINLVLLDV